jgi:phenylacetate-coenzyme A ligase PaaK-like adenylate-forming protein
MTLNSELESREQWRREELLRYQARRLDDLIRHASRRSPFYRELYRDLRTPGPESLEQLPVTNKDLIMENFDSVVTDPRLKLDRLQAHLHDLTAHDDYLGSYHVLATAGSSGRVGIVVFDRDEWATVLAAWLRCIRWMDTQPNAGGHIRFALIAADSPVHTTYRMASSLDIGVPRSLRMSATDPLPRLVGKLNSYQPEMLMVYPSIGAILAEEQLEGRLQIHPRIVVTAGEWRTKTAEEGMIRAWGVTPFNDYGLTEVPVGIDCTLHHGIHVFEDLCVIEVVDDSNRTVPPGTSGEKILITNLFNYTQPLIRYEVSDLVTMSSEPCPCGLPFSFISQIEGRLDDVLYLPGQAGEKVPVHANHFVTAMKGLGGVRRYRVEEREDGIHVFVEPRVDARREELGSEIEVRVRRSLHEAGVRDPVLRITFVEEIRGEPAASGKFKVVQSLRAQP